MSTTSTGSSSPPEPGHAPSTPTEIRAALGRLGVAPTKRLGQSFLADPFIADAEAALIPDDLPVVEVGGGLGILTEALLRRRRRGVTVIERDARLAQHLRQTFGASITVVEGDAREVPIAPEAAVVGNLPFSVATPILLRCFGLGTPRLVAMVQREVAERLASGPGSKEYGRLSIAAALYGTVELFQAVPARAFTPVPAVDGRILCFVRRTTAIPVPSVPEFERVVGALFASRRKQLRNLLPRVVPRGVDPNELAQRSGWPDGWARLRPEELAPEAYFRLATERERMRTARQV